MLFLRIEHQLSRSTSGQGSMQLKAVSIERARLIGIKSLNSVTTNAGFCENGNHQWQRFRTRSLSLCRRAKESENS